MEFLLAGFLGGAIRGTMGVVKYTLSYKDVAMRPWYFVGTVAVAGAIGFLVAWIVQDLGISFLGVETVSPAIAVIVGYAGGDFLENIFKIITRDTVLFQKQK